MKQSPWHKLEKQKGVFLQIGLIISLLIVYFILEWQTPDKQENMHHYAGIDVEVEIIPVRNIIVEKPVPPKPMVNPMLNIVEDALGDIEEVDVNTFDAETDENEEVYDFNLKEEDPEIFTCIIAEKMPEFPGGYKTLIKYLSKHMNYPQEAIEKDIQGRVYVRFLINKDGKLDSISNVNSLHPLLDSEAVRVVSAMPDWAPGKQNGKPVNVWYTLPVTFKLN